MSSPVHTESKSFHNTQQKDGSLSSKSCSRLNGRSYGQVQKLVRRTAVVYIRAFVTIQDCIMELTQVLSDTILIYYVTLLESEIAEPPRKKRKWIKPWLERRNEQGAGANLLCELRLEDSESYR